MKLLQKTNRAYFLISAATFIIAGATFYFVISFFFKDQLNEKLVSDIRIVKTKIEKKEILPHYYPFIEIRKVSEKESSFKIIDTLIYDEAEEKNISFRQISKTYSIGGINYLIIARDTLLEEDDLLQAIAMVTGIVFVLLLVLLYFFNRKLSLNIWKPFYKTMGELKSFSHDEPGFKLSVDSQIDEFKELNDTLKRLTQKVISDYQSLKRFTEDASHEIQNPLAVVQSKLETLMQSGDLEKEQVELINSAYAFTLRISKLTQTLLLLTKIANEQFPEKKAVDISELLEDKIKFFEDYFNEKSLVINKEIDPGYILTTNYFLAESVIANLIGNGIKHNIKGGIIKIRLYRGFLEVSNSGIPLNISSEKIFERFYKADKSSESQGLGLAIVKEICQLNNWMINYIYEDDMHKFIIRF